MSYSEYYFCSRRETENRYQEYGGKIQKGEGNSYQEYGDPKMAGTDSVFNNKGGAHAPVNLAAFDDEMERYCEQQRKIKAERLAKRTAYCDEHNIQGDIREKILKGRISIEEFEALQKSATDVVEAEQAPEAPETPVEEPVAEQPVDTTAEPVEKPKKRSKKKSEEV